MFSAIVRSTLYMFLVKILTASGMLVSAGLSCVYFGAVMIARQKCSWRLSCADHAPRAFRTACRRLIDIHARRLYPAAKTPIKTIASTSMRPEILSKIAQFNECSQWLFQPFPASIGE